LGRVLRTEFFQEIGSVEFDGARADIQPPSNLLARAAPDDFAQDETLPRSQMSLDFRGLGGGRRRPSGSRLPRFGKHLLIEEASWRQPGTHRGDHLSVAAKSRRRSSTDVL